MAEKKRRRPDALAFRSGDRKDLYLGGRGERERERERERWKETESETEKDRDRQTEIEKGGDRIGDKQTDREGGLKRNHQ